MTEHITVAVLVTEPIKKVWEYFTQPEHVMRWNNASPDWHTPLARNDLREGGTFSYRMEAKDKSNGFDFEGTYSKVVTNEIIEYMMSDGRKVSIDFVAEGDNTRIIETFDAETENPIEMQRAGWQSILDNFKVYIEGGREE